MMANLRLGDMVVVVTPESCGCTAKLGRVFRIERVEWGANGWCTQCGTPWVAAEALPHAMDDRGIWTEFSRLRKLLGRGSAPLAAERETT